MKTIRNIIKNIVIIALVFLTLLQTGRLWFGAPIDKNFFRTIINQMTVPVEDFPETAYLLLPYRIISGNGDFFWISYSDASESGGMQTVLDILDELFKDALYAREKEPDFSALSPCLIFEYAVPVPADIFCEIILQTPKRIQDEAGIITDHIASVGRIVFMPIADELVGVFFTDAYSGKSYEYSVRITDAIYDSLTKTINRESGVKYTGYPFIPYVKAPIDYTVLRAVNPYMSSGGTLTLRSVERELALLFSDNPITFSAPDDNSFRFTNDANVVCRYNLSNHLIEYSDYSRIETDKSNSFAENFAVARRFIERDNIQHDFSLAAYSFNGEEHVFYFSLAVLDFPILIIGEETPYFIEITAQRQKVVKYQRYAHYFVPHEKAEFSSERGDIEVLGYGYEAGQGLVYLSAGKH